MIKDSYSGKNAMRWDKNEKFIIKNETSKWVLPTSLVREALELVDINFQFNPAWCSSPQFHHIANLTQTPRAVQNEVRRSKKYIK